MSNSEKTLDIAMLGHKHFPSREGGIEIVVEELGTRMIKRGNKVTVYNRSGHHISGEEYDIGVRHEYKGIRIKYVWTIKRRGIAAVTSSVTASIKASLGRHDVVHYHAEGPSFMCWLPKLFGKRVVVTIHGLDWQRAKWGKFASWYIMHGEKMAVKKADEIIVLSTGEQKYFKDTYGRDTVYIPNGVEKPILREAQEIRKRWGLEKDSYVLFLGRLVPEKGLRYLIEAWKRLKTDKKLVLAGGSSDTKDFVNELKENSNESILYTGFIQGRILEELYSNAYFYCLPSDLEGMPLSLLEAMSYGNCCLVSDISECTEVVEDKAVVFERANVDDLAEKMQLLLAQPEIVAHYRQNASEFICGKYNWEDVVDKTLALYRCR